jgi:circadian clock protein KaiB
VIRETSKKAALRLRLYIAGNAQNSLRAIVNARAICDKYFSDSYDLEIVDMFIDPERALTDRIIVTPTLLKLFPSPARRMIGDLSDTNLLLLTLQNR